MSVTRIQDFLEERKKAERESLLEEVAEEPYHLVVLRPGYQQDEDFAQFVAPMSDNMKEYLFSVEAFPGYYGNVSGGLFDYEFDTIPSLIFQTETLEFADLTYFRKHPGTGIYQIDKLALHIFISQYTNSSCHPTVANEVKDEPIEVVNMRKAIDEEHTLTSIETMVSVFSDAVFPELREDLEKPPEVEFVKQDGFLHNIYLSYGIQVPDGSFTVIKPIVPMRGPFTVQVALEDGQLTAVAEEAKTQPDSSDPSAISPVSSAVEPEQK